MLLLTEGTLKSLLHEDFARTNKIGMWSMEFDYPWDWRKKN